MSRIPCDLVEAMERGDYNEFERIVKEREIKEEDCPDMFASYYMETLQNLERIPLLMENLKHPWHRHMVALMCLGEPHEALRHLRDMEDIPLKAVGEARVHYLMGKDYDPNRLKGEDDITLPKALQVLRGFVGGEIVSTLEVASHVANRIIDSERMPAATTVELLSAAFRNDRVALRYITLSMEHLKMRRQAVISSVFERFLKGERIGTDTVPKGCDYVRAYVSLANAFLNGERIRPPNDLYGVYNLFWYLDKVRRGVKYLSFAGELKLMEGVKEVKVPRRKSLVVLAYLKALGKDKMMEYAGKIFPESLNPRRRVVEYLSSVKEYHYVPSDLHITLRFGNFLKKEVGGSLRLLRDLMTGSPP